MAISNASTLPTGWSPEDYGQLIDTVIAAKSVAFQVSTLVTTSNETIRFPMLTADPAVGWYAENSQISLEDPSVSELVITPKKVAGLTQISNEAAEDSTPAVADQVGMALGRSIAKKIDAAFFANTTSNGPAGLVSLSGSYNGIDTTTYPLTNLDAFHQGKAAALADGANITHWVIAADVALTLSKLKAFVGEDISSNAELISTGVSDGTVIAGAPVIVSANVASGEAWGVDASQVFMVQRTGTTVTRSTDMKFDYDAVVVRATARVSWGFANPAGVVRIADLTP